MSRAHSETGPSKAEIWLNCHGSVSLSRGIEDVETPASAEGTVAHVWLEKAQGEGLKVLKECPDMEMAFHAEGCVTFINSIEKKVGGFEKKWTEERVRFNDMLWGSSDFSAVYKEGKRLVIVDYKYGKRVGVVAEDNAQLAAYALCVINTHELEVEQATVFIYQPRAMDGEGDVRHWTMKKADIIAWRKKFLRALNAIKDIDAGKIEPTYKVGDWCGWCKAKRDCKTFWNESGEKALAVLDKAGPLLPDPSKMSKEDLERALSVEPALMEFYKALKPYMLENAKNGVDYKGFKLVEGKSSRRWNGDEDEIASELFRRGMKDPWNRKLKGLGDVEKEIGKGKIGDLVIKPPGKISLVTEEDARPALTVVDAVDLLDEI